MVCVVDAAFSLVMLCTLLLRHGWCMLCLTTCTARVLTVTIHFFLCVLRYFKRSYISRNRGVMSGACASMPDVWPLAYSGTERMILALDNPRPLNIVCTLRDGGAFYNVVRGQVLSHIYDTESMLTLSTSHDPLRFACTHTRTRVRTRSSVDVPPVENACARKQAPPWSFTHPHVARHTYLYAGDQMDASVHRKEQCSKLCC